MAKGYWIARVDVHNMDGYKEYVAQNGAVFAKYGARFLVRCGKHEAKEGSSRSRNVVLEFKDYETALASSKVTMGRSRKVRRNGTSFLVMAGP